MTYSIKNFNNIRREAKAISKHKSISINNSRKLQGYSKVQLLQKRTIDLIIGSTLFLITIPVILFSIYKIKRESPGPIFFKQSRIGKDGKPFTCYKFRSMHTNGKFNPYTQENDSRIFPFGNTMRKMRIDELPQLLNILKGEMHLIGPRAEWDILVKDYENIIPKYHERHLVAPGITGLAQVSYPYGRNVEDAKKKLTYDMNYINNWSLLKEIKVMILTVGVILGKRGM